MPLRGPAVTRHDEKPYGISACRYGNDARGESSAGLTSECGGLDSDGSFGRETTISERGRRSKSRVWHRTGSRKGPCHAPGGSFKDFWDAASATSMIA